MAESKGKKFKDLFSWGKGSRNIQEITQRDLISAEALYGYDPVTVTTLLGSGKRISRSRQILFEKLHFMMTDPIINAALTLHVTNALGGDPSSGDRIFIEPVANATETQGKIAAELKADLEEMFNRVSFQTAFNGAGFGDAYARAYALEKQGIVDIYIDEMVWPPLVQPYEKASKTVGYTVAVGKEYVERLTIKQMARMKMPRKGYVAQSLVVEKAVRASLTEDDPNNLPIQPALIGGSLCLSAEDPYDWLQTALTGLVSQRIISSVDENLLSVNTEGMTKAQRTQLMDSLKNMLVASKARVEEAIQSGNPITERIYHIMPTNGEKQIANISQFQGVSGGQSYTIEDVMTYMKMLAGALGIDLSMLGFADILSGGLGEGGFFRTSAQAAEVSQMIRGALADFYHDLIDIHMIHKHGYVFEESERPYKINFFGSISALEGEKAESRERSMNGTMLMGQALEGLKSLGLSKETLKQVMVDEMGMDADLAEIIATDMAAKPEEEPPAF